jgi:hypothetical protein
LYEYPSPCTCALCLSKMQPWIFIG